MQQWSSRGESLFGEFREKKCPAVSVPRETRAGTARLSIQKETQDSITISMVGK